MKYTQATSEAKKTNKKQEDRAVGLRGANEIKIAIVNEPSASGYFAINAPSSSQDVQGAAKSVRKLRRIDAAPDPSSTGSSPVTVFTVPRPRQGF